MDLQIPTTYDNLIQYLTKYVTKAETRSEAASVLLDLSNIDPNTNMVSKMRSWVLK